MTDQAQVSEELIRMILQYLWQRHLAAEQQYLWWILGAPLLALMVFLILWWKHRGHASSLVEAIGFFFAPRGPEKMLIFKDIDGDIMMLYDYRVVKGENGYMVYAGPVVAKTVVDPDAYAEPLSLIDTRGPPGIPSPFGLFVRQLISVYIMISVIAIAFVNTFYTTYDPYMRYSEYLGSISWTTIDLLAFAALVISVAWLIAVLIRALSPQTLVTHLVAVGVSGVHVDASPGLDVYSRFPPMKLLKSLGKEVRIVVPESVKQFFEAEKERVGDEVAAAEQLSSIARIPAWKRTVGKIQQDQYDISVAARARYQLSEEKLPKGFLARYAGVLALVAIVGMIVLAALWLQPSLGPAATNTTTTTTTGIQVITPAQPPQLTTTTTPPVSPPAPPTPPIAPSGG